jgi:hypothetical protein
MQEAKALSKPLEGLRNSITAGQGSLAGCLGEVCLRDYLRASGTQVEIVGDYQFDLLVDSKYTIEVKTKRCTSEPKPHYEGSVALFNDRQSTKYYAFTRVDTERQLCYLMGYITKKRFFRVARKMAQGDQDSNLVNGEPFQIRADCWNIYYKQLKEFK